MEHAFDPGSSPGWRRIVGSVKAPLNTSCVTASVRVTAVGGKPVPRRRPVPYPTGPCRSPGPVRSLCTLKLPVSGTGPPSRLTIHAAATDPGPQPAPVAGPVGLSDPQLSHYHISRPCAAGPAPARGSRPSDMSLAGPTGLRPGARVSAGPSAELSRARRQPPSPVLAVCCQAMFLCNDPTGH